jgi:hypothetical protein
MLIRAARGNSWVFGSAAQAIPSQSISTPADFEDPHLIFLFLFEPS